MALPAGGEAWPPAPYEIALSQQAVWDAWYAGDRTRLASIYGGADATVRGDLTERRGGVLPALARFFWGRPSVSGQPRQKLHIPLAADIATASADLLFSEPPQFILADGKDKKAQERIDGCLNQGDFHAALLEAAELAAALGGCWLRLAWDADLFDQVIAEGVPADSAIGEWRWGRLEAVTFFTELAADKEKDEVIRHLERHEKGAVLHGLYRGKTASLGERIRLEEHPATEGLSPLANEEGAIPTEAKGLTAGYVANMRPQRTWRKMEALRELGRSDYDQSEPLMDALDEVYTSWMRDIRLAKARLLVPEYFLESLGKGRGSAFDEDREIFTQLRLAPSEDKGTQITPQQFDIRVTEHRETADDLIDRILETAGYSPSTFGRGGEGDKTATEVVSRERQSSRTRDKKTRYWSQAFQILDTWAELDARIFRSGAKGPILVEWPDSSQPDPEALSRTIQTLYNAEAASTEVRVRMAHPDWDEEQIKEEVGRIQKESGRTVPDVGPLGGE